VLIRGKKIEQRRVRHHKLIIYVFYIVLVGMYKLIFHTEMYLIARSVIVQPQMAVFCKACIYVRDTTIMWHIIKMQINLGALLIDLIHHLILSSKVTAKDNSFYIMISINKEKATHI